MTIGIEICSCSISMYIIGIDVVLLKCRGGTAFDGCDYLKSQSLFCNDKEVILVNESVC